MQMSNRAKAQDETGQSAQHDTAAVRLGGSAAMRHLLHASCAVAGRFVLATCFARQYIVIAELNMAGGWPGRGRGHGQKKGGKR